MLVVATKKRHLVQHLKRVGNATKPPCIYSANPDETTTPKAKPKMRERTKDQGKEKLADHTVHSGMQKDEDDKKPTPLTEWLVLRLAGPTRHAAAAICWRLPGSRREWPERSVTKLLEWPLVRFGALVPPVGTK